MWNTGPCQLRNATMIEDYGCALNATDPDDVFGGYLRARFLYPAKLRRLAPVLPKVTDNWRKAFAGGNSLLCVVTRTTSDGGWASVSHWRSTHTTWVSQHLVSTGGPQATRAVVLAQQALKFHSSECNADQIWFQRRNRYANRVFGPIDKVLGIECASVAELDYLEAPVRPLHENTSDVTIVPCQDGSQSELFSLATRIRGPIYATAEELDHDDLLLDEVDQMYRAVGLRRYRRIWLAMIA